ncbi:TPR domain-containing protein [Cyclospora cayetanensis]|uniref:TPR domain-containing protein n=1 Tax=Cyclospora cayetanensis TaxID=88456 RepID=A0A1D3D9S9_9EIME|nr:TPR domain-containing protein [Cyclospora cayetanensis]
MQRTQIIKALFDGRGSAHSPPLRLQAKLEFLPLSILAGAEGPQSLVAAATAAAARAGVPLCWGSDGRLLSPPSTAAAAGTAEASLSVVVVPPEGIEDIPAAHAQVGAQQLSRDRVLHHINPPDNAKPQQQQPYQRSPQPQQQQQKRKQKDGDGFIDDSAEGARTAIDAAQEEGFGSATVAEEREGATQTSPAAADGDVGVAASSLPAASAEADGTATGDEQLLSPAKRQRDLAVGDDMEAASPTAGAANRGEAAEDLVHDDSDDAEASSAFRKKHSKHKSKKRKKKRSKNVGDSD